MDYNQLKKKYKHFMKYETENHSIILNISNFRIDEYKGNHNEFVQYVVFIILKVKENNIKNGNLATAQVDMKNVTSSHFHPFFLKKVTDQIKIIFKDMLEDTNKHLLGKIYIRSVGKYGITLWSIVKPLFHKETLAKMVITR